MQRQAPEAGQFLASQPQSFSDDKWEDFDIQGGVDETYNPRTLTLLRQQRKITSNDISVHKFLNDN